MPAVAKRKQMRHQLAFECKPVVSDGYGGTEGDFAQVFRCAAALEARLGGEQIMASRLAGVQPFTISVRQSTRTKMVTTDWRARGVCSCHAGKLFQIRSIADPDDGRQYFDMLAELGPQT